MKYEKNDVSNVNVKFDKVGFRLYILALREEHSLTQGGLAQLAGISVTSISRIENEASTPEIAAITKLCMVGGCDIWDFMRRITAKEKRNSEGES